MVAVAALIGLAVFVSAVVEGDVPDALGAGTQWLRHLVHQQGHLSAFGPLYI